MCEAAHSECRDAGRQPDTGTVRAISGKYKQCCHRPTTGDQSPCSKLRMIMSGLVQNDQIPRAGINNAQDLHRFAFAVAGCCCSCSEQPKVRSLCVAIAPPNSGVRSRVSYSRPASAMTFLRVQKCATPNPRRRNLTRSCARCSKWAWGVVVDHAGLITKPRHLRR